MESVTIFLAIPYDGTTPHVRYVLDKDADVTPREIEDKRQELTEASDHFFYDVIHQPVHDNIKYLSP